MRTKNNDVFAAACIFRCSGEVGCGAGGHIHSTAARTHDYAHSIGVATTTARTLDTDPLTLSSL